MQVDVVTGGTRGLQLDAELIKSSLHSGDICNIYTPRRRNLQLPLTRVKLGLQCRLLGRPDLLIFLENIHSSWAKIPTKKILISNQEWIRKESLPSFSNCEEIWCKTRYAHKQFSERGYRSRYIGFKSRDLLIDAHEKNQNLCIHVAGRSHLKGTRTLLELWKRHSEWPQLLVIATPSDWIQSFRSSNIRLQRNDLSDTAIRKIMNEASIHLCPSEAEGFGHYISEAMSTKSLIVTTDAPPMNEIANGPFSFRASIYSKEPMGFGERFFPDPDSLEQQIQQALATNSQERLKYGTMARQTFIEQSTNFDSLVREAISTVAGKSIQPAP